MTNKEFYGDKLMAIVLEDSCHKLHKAVHGERCMEKDCKNCEFYTVESIEKWLNAEHEEPPPLENGDDLKPGDWIMVRDGDIFEWDKRQFMCYFDHHFYCVSGADSMEDRSFLRATGWQQARLPMEGECK